MSKVSGKAKSNDDWKWALALASAGGDRAWFNYVI